MRALVLGGGGATGIGWECGVLAGLAASGVDVASADLVIGTSAGALVGALLCVGLTPEDLSTTVVDRVRTLGRADARAIARLAGGQVARDRAALIRRFGAIQRVSSGLDEEAFVHGVADYLIGRPWPANLVVTTVDTASGLPVAHDADSGLDLGRVVAASCAVPGIFPAVRLNGVRHLDGGVHTPANAHLAASADCIIALTPFHRTAATRRPESQLGRLQSSRWLLLRPDAVSVRAIGLDPLSAARTALARDAGRRQALVTADVARRIWG